MNKPATPSTTSSKPVSQTISSGDSRVVEARPESAEPAVERYTPSTEKVPARVWTQIRPAVTSIASKAAPTSGLDAKSLLGPLSQFFAWQIALGTDANSLAETLTEREIARWVRTELDGLSSGTKGNYRTSLRRCAEALNPTGQPFRPAGLHGANPDAPYTEAEIVDFVNWAANQNTDRRRQGLEALLAAGFGAGLSTNDLRLLRGSDVQNTSHGVEVTVRESKNARTVIVHDRWADRMLASARLAGNDLYFLPGRGTENRNLVTNFVHRVPRSAGPVLSSSRMRTTWLVGHLNAGVPIRALLDASGISAPAALDRYMCFVDAIDLADASAWMRGDQ